jgi:hypothetical protein
MQHLILIAVDPLLDYPFHRRPWPMQEVMGMQYSECVVLEDCLQLKKQGAIKRLSFLSAARSQDLALDHALSLGVDRAVALQYFPENHQEWAKVLSEKLRAEADIDVIVFAAMGGAELTTSLALNLNWHFMMDVAKMHWQEGRSWLQRAAQPAVELPEQACIFWQPGRRPLRQFDIAKILEISKSQKLLWKGAASQNHALDREAVFLRRGLSLTENSAAELLAWEREQI